MKHEQGTALLSVMLIVIVVGVITSMAFERNRLLNRERVSTIAEHKAFHAADGGLEWAIHSLDRDPKSQGRTLQLGDCSVRVIITHHKDGSAQIASRATLYPRGAKALPHTHTAQLQIP